MYSEDGHLEDGFEVGVLEFDLGEPVTPRVGNESSSEEAVGLATMSFTDHPGEMFRLFFTASVLHLN